ncbi:YidB family protein [Embleya sp. NPDC050154]|uniref:YidB family protein n=1 Tax=Embleya sp. NPDC050154 TaxID=3363988 RepID=UPI0037A5CA1A
MAEAGLKSRVRSWVGDGPNEAITADRIVSVVGEDQLARAAESLERRPGESAVDLAARLPGLVDAAAPDTPATADIEGGFPGPRIRWASSTAATAWTCPTRCRSTACRPSTSSTSGGGARELRRIETAAPAGVAFWGGRGR